MESRTQRRAASTRLAILQAAETLLTEGGLDAVTPEAVATRADVAVQTLYNRVGGRSALLIAVAERALEENREYMDAAYASDGDVETKLRYVAAAYARFAKERPHQFRILVEPPNEPEALARIAALIRQQNAKLAALISRGIDEGWVHADVEPEHASTALWAMMNGVISLMWRPDSLRLDVDHIDDLLRTAISLLTGGIKRRGD
ncbi:TetR family transcriptional regulator [Burkholderia lata]|uniref:TetR/AcrR family transcriptional regulator n=1 Tax=Burkholderia lata (strain ATCC 17760 / DSM 23089 / LMG 22485 / NCIMB 9086 / R18194 / 383) TaxID=482957 RepID=UPI001454124F|nr:TetR/AcrR family transcriptional regulator [Burkholderia lata]VWC50016.1 TetR family transcriptional regulator [Burkholderia lata]